MRWSPHVKVGVLLYCWCYQAHFNLVLAHPLCRHGYICVEYSYINNPFIVHIQFILKQLRPTAKSS